MTQTNFKRYELKYILTAKQYKILLEQMPFCMKLDRYGRHRISNIYFDTDDYRVIRHSLEKPKYKEKLRVRCYGEPREDTTVFIELKKKYNGVVYKRRIYSEQNKVFAYLCKEIDAVEHSQILSEIAYFKNRYHGIKPKVYLSYEREAFFSTEDENFRLTFDFNISARDNNVSLYKCDDDMEVLSNEYVLLEVKTVMGLPPWFLEFLSENDIYKTSFSKYGMAFQRYFSSQFISTLRGAANA